MWDLDYAHHMLVIWQMVHISLPLLRSSAHFQMSNFANFHYRIISFILFPYYLNPVNPESNEIQMIWNFRSALIQISFTNHFIIWRIRGSMNRIHLFAVYYFCYVQTIINSMICDWCILYSTAMKWSIEALCLSSSFLCVLFHLLAHRTKTEWERVRHFCKGIRLKYSS